MGTVTSKDGTSISFTKTGAGPTVLLVDGAMCYRNFGPMGALSEQLAPNFTVITYDRRGRGESGDTAPYAVEREVEDIDALIQSAGGAAYVYGVSSGAALALTAAGRLPGVTKLALYEPPFMLDDSRPPLPADYADHFKQLLAEGRRGDMIEYFMTVGVLMPAEMVAPMRQMPMWPALEAVAPTLIYDTAIMGNSFSRAYLDSLTARIHMPTFVACGGASPQSLQTPAQVIAESIPGTEHHVLPGQTHDVAAEAIAPLLIDFFNR